MDQKMQSTDQREKLKIRYKQLLKLYVIICIAALPIVSFHGLCNTYL